MYDVISYSFVVLGVGPWLSVSWPQGRTYFESLALHFIRLTYDKCG